MCCCARHSRATCATAIALYSFKGNEQDGELSFQAGDTVEIISRSSPDDPDFWEGRYVPGPTRERAGVRVGGGGGA